MYKKIMIILFLSVLLNGCMDYEDDVFVGNVKEIKSVSAGGFGTLDKAHIVLHNNREIVVSKNIEKLEIGSEIWTANGYPSLYRVKP